jgi:hypothetical protein
VANPRPLASTELLRQTKDELVGRVMNQAKELGHEPTTAVAESVVLPVLRRAEVKQEELRNKDITRAEKQPEPPKKYVRVDGDALATVHVTEDGRVVRVQQHKPERRRRIPSNKGAFHAWFSWLLTIPEWRDQVTKIFFQRKQHWQLMNETMELVDRSLVKFKDTPQYKVWGIQIAKTPRGGSEQWGPGRIPK